MPSPAFVSSKAQLGYGAGFFIGAGSPVTYTEVSEISSISLNLTVTEIDTTHLGSPNTTEESIPGMIRPGNVEMTGNYICDTSQMAIDGMMVARTIFPWIITGPTADNKTLTIAGMGYLTRKEPGPWEANKKVDFKISVRMAGLLTWTVA